MKILLVTQLLPYPPKGGSPQRVYNLLKECAKTNDIDMLAFYRKSHQRSPAEIDEAITSLKQFCKKIEIFKIPADQNKILWYLLLFFNLFSTIPYSVWLYKSRKMKEAIRLYIENSSYDIVEFGEIGLAGYAGMASETTRILVHQNVESGLLYRRMKYSKNWLAKLYLFLQSVKLRNYERSAGSIFDFHIAVSEADKKTLLEILPAARIAVIPNGVDTDYFKATDDKMEPNSLIYVGGMTWFPNYDAMLYFIKEILPLIRSEIPDIHLHCIGRQIDNRFHNMAAGNSALEIHGFVDDIRPLITKSAVFIVPLRIGGGTRLKIVDAMSMGKAIVSTSVGCEGLRIEDGKDIMIANSPRDFTDKVIEILRNPPLQENLMKHARHTAREIYSWQIIAPMLIKAYEEAVMTKTGDQQ